MRDCVDLNQRIAKKLLLDMVKNNDDKLSLECSLINELTDEPSRIFKAIDALMDCQDKIPCWAINKVRKIFDIPRLNSKEITYSLIAEDTKTLIINLFDTTLFIKDREIACPFVKNSDTYCWICDKAENYHDCMGNDMLKIESREDWFDKFEVESWLMLNELDIGIGNAEAGSIIKCYQCDLQWSFSKKYISHWYKDSDTVHDYIRKDEILNKWMKDDTAEWYRCPYGCNVNQYSTISNYALKYVVLKNRYDQIKKDVEILIEAENMNYSGKSLRHRFDMVLAIEYELFDLKVLFPRTSIDFNFIDNACLSLAGLILDLAEEGIKSMNDSRIKEMPNIINIFNGKEYHMKEMV